MLIGIGLLDIISCATGLLRLSVLEIREIPPITIKIQQITVIDFGLLFIIFPFSRTFELTCRATFAIHNLGGIAVKCSEGFGARFSPSFVSLRI